MERLKFILKWLAVSLSVGLLGGVIGALFSHSISFVTNLRGNNGWMIYLLPLGGLMSVYIYRTLKTKGQTTNTVLKSLRGEKKVSPLLLPSVFAGSVITHAFGGSAGREGAALQMGGGAAALVSRFFKLSEEEGKIATVCGMAAFFSALFGTPLGAAIFAVEIMFSKKLSFKSILPATVTSVISVAVAKLFSAKGESFELVLPDFSVLLLVKTLAIMICSSAICIVWIFCLKKSKILFKRLFKNDYLKITVGAGLIILLTLIFKTTDYNGGGMNVVERIFSDDEVKYEAFALKILFTCITVAAGFKGGEIVPTFFIGATYGGTIALILGVPMGLGAAIGMAALFSGATSCPVATVFICAEMFGIKGTMYFVAAAVISQLLTGKKRIYNP